MSKIISLVTSPKGKWAVVLLWILVGVVVIRMAPPLVDETNPVNFLPDDAGSTKAYELVLEKFPAEGTPAIVVLRDLQGISNGFEGAEGFSQWLESPGAPTQIRRVISVYNNPNAAAELISADQTAMTIIVDMSGNPAEDSFIDAVREIRDRAEQLEFGTETLVVAVGGPAGLIVDLLDVFLAIDGLLLMVTVVLVLVLLLLIYRSPVVAVIPLLMVGLVFQMALSLIAFFADMGDFLAINGQSQGIMTVVLFGSGTDYCLFISARYREELRVYQDKHQAMAAAMKGVGGAIVSAAGTIVIATVVLLLAVLRSFQSMGPVIGIAVALMMVAAITLVPATLTILGRASFWPFRPTYLAVAERQTATQTRDTLYGKVADKVLHRPMLTLSLTVGVLGFCIFGLYDSHRTFDRINSLPANTESVEAFDMLRESFPAGDSAPTSLYISLPSGTTSLLPYHLEEIDSVAMKLLAEAQLSKVSHAGRPFSSNSPIGPKEVSIALGSASAQSGSNLPVSGVYTRAMSYVSKDMSTLRIELVLEGNPYTTEALDFIPRIREIAADASKSLSWQPAVVLVGGQTAEAYDQRSAIDRDTFLILPLILLAIGIILGVLLRSIIAPIYLVATIMFTYFATLGLSVLVFENLLGQPELNPVVPFFLFVFLNALGVDYNIYLMSRIREESKKSPLPIAIRNALSQTGGVITSAGLILAGTFSALMVLPLQDIFQLGFAVAAGVIMDTFITRTLIVPALVSLLGDWNWWPVHVRHTHAPE